MVPSARLVLSRAHRLQGPVAMTIQPPPNDETPPPVPETDDQPTPIDTPDEPMPEQRAPGVNEPPMGAPRDEPDLELS
jgi:hypothetical protein